jgi:hypothetical protein
MNTIALLILTLSICFCATAQPNPDTLWTRTYGGSGYDYAHSVQQTTDGGYIAAGRTTSFGADIENAYLVKMNSQGDTLWTHTYEDCEMALCIQQTTDGGYILAGETWSFGAGMTDFYLVKTDSQGDTLWTRTYGGSNYDDALSVQQTTDGGYIVAGLTYSFGAGGGGDFYLVRTDSQGDTLWTRIYGGSSDDAASSVQQTNDGGYIVAGGTMSFGAGDYDFYLVKTGSHGDTLWTRTYGGNSYDYANSVQQTDDEGYIVAGCTYSFGAGSYDCYLVKTDSQGDTLWTRTYGRSDYDFAWSVQQTTDGGYIVAGGTGWSSGAGSDDCYLVKTDSQGDTLWTRTYGGGYGEEALSVQQTIDGGYIMAGYTTSFEGYSDFYLVKTGPDIPPAPPGPFERMIPADSSTAPEAQIQFAWTRSVDPNGDDVTYLLHFESPTYLFPDPHDSTTTDTSIVIEIPIPVDPLDEIHEFRWTVHATANGDTVEASNSVGIFYFDVPGAADEGLSTLPKEFTLNASPNPFNPSTVITYSIPTANRVSLRVFDLLGREVVKLYDGFAEAGDHRIIFDGSGLASGVYLYRLQAGGFVQAKKMVLIK